MYGFFNRAFEHYFIHTYGDTLWEEVKMNANFYEESFDEGTVYDDNMISDLMDVACDLLDIELEELQENFGESYFTHCLSSKHGKLLKALGGNLYDFLTNIDSLHDHLSSTFAGVKLPTFRVKHDNMQRSISVNYYSDRQLQLEYVTKGIIKMAAKVLFDLDVTVETILDTDAFKFLVATEDVDQSHLMFPKSIASSRDLIPRANEPKVAPLEFCKAFPFHIVFDRNMKLIQIGSTLRRVLKDITTDAAKTNSSKNTLVTDFFSLSRPQIYFDFESIYSRLNNAFVLTSLKDVVKAGPSIIQIQSSNDTTPRRTNLRLKGQMIFLEDADAMLFLCSPSVSNIEDMRNKGLCLSDIPIHDATRDLVLLSENFQRELELTQQLGIVSDHLQKIHTELEEETTIFNRLLFAVLPSSIANDLKNNKPVPTEKFESVTLMFSGIVDFTALCEGLDPFDIVNMLNRLYTKFDMLVGMLDIYVYKVETIGDKYMTASGLPVRCSNHAQVICTLALDMMDAANELSVKGKNISVTFGIHSGEVVAGVIGQRMPRYCLFGNSVNLTSRTETTGLKGFINLTEDTYQLLEEKDSVSEFRFKMRGQVKMKGKEELMTTYTLHRQESRDRYSAAYPRASFDFDERDLRLDRLNLSMFGGDQSSSVLTSPIDGKGGFTLNRSRCNSGTSVNMRRSRPTSNIGSRFNTPGASRSNSRYVTPLRSRSNSRISTSPFNNTGAKILEGRSYSVDNLDILEERSKTNDSNSSPISKSPPLDHNEIEAILQEVNSSLEKKK